MLQSQIKLQATDFVLLDDVRALGIATMKVCYPILYLCDDKSEQMAQEMHPVMTHLSSLFQFQGVFPCGFQSSVYFPDFYSPHSLWQFQVRWFFKAL